MVFFIYFCYTFYFYLYIIDFLYQLFFLFCNNAFEQGHLDTWRYKNALIIIIIIIFRQHLTRCFLSDSIEEQKEGSACYQ